MTFTPDRVVVLAKKVEGGFALIGSGVVIASGRVLTARHVIDRHATVDTETGVPSPALYARRDGSSTFVELSRVLWRGEGSVDAALLQLDVATVAQASPTALLEGAELRDQRPWFARGYPMVNPNAPQAALASVNGGVHRFWSHEAAMRLGVKESPQDFRGLSGAAVTLSDRERVVAVVRSVPDDWDRKLLTATPVAAMLRDAEFIKALGVTDGHDALAKRVAKVADEVAQRLQGRAKIIASIATELAIEAACDARTLADTLVRARSAQTVAKCLNDVDDELANGSTHERRDDDRRVVQEIFWLVMRFAPDWSSVQAARCGAFESERRDEPVSVELTLTSLTVAEVVLAGLDNRRPSFVRDAKAPTPAGAGMLRLSAKEDAPIFARGGRRALDGVVRHLCNEFGEPEFRAMPEDLNDTDAKPYRDHAAGKLNHHTYKGRRSERKHRYLMVREDELAKTGAMGDPWETLQRAVHAVIPSLRIVLLVKGESEDELDTAEHIASMERNRIP